MDNLKTDQPQTSSTSQNNANELIPHPSVINSFDKEGLKGAVSQAVTSNVTDDREAHIKEMESIIALHPTLIIPLTAKAQFNYSSTNSDSLQLVATADLILTKIDEFYGAAYKISPLLTEGKVRINALLANPKSKWDTYNELLNIYNHQSQISLVSAYHFFFITMIQCFINKPDLPENVIENDIARNMITNLLHTNDPNIIDQNVLNQILVTYKLGTKIEATFGIFRFRETASVAPNNRQLAIQSNTALAVKEQNGQMVDVLSKMVKGLANASITSHEDLRRVTTQLSALEKDAGSIYEALTDLKDNLEPGSENIEIVNAVIESFQSSKDLTESIHKQANSTLVEHNATIQEVIASASVNNHNGKRIKDNSMFTNADENYPNSRQRGSEVDTDSRLEF